jgi:hypothetical protein
MVRPVRKCRYNHLSGGEVEETAAAADQRNLITKASITDMAAKVENDWRENIRKLSRAHDVSSRMVYAELSKKSARWVNKQFSLEMKKERFRTCEAAEAMAAAIL